MPNAQYNRLGLEKRFLILRIVFFVTFFLLALSLIYFQLINGGEYARLASHNRLRILRVLPARGMIYDTNGAPLAVNVRTFNICGYAFDLRDDEKLGKIVEILKKGGIPTTKAELTEKLQRQYSAPYRAITVASNLTFAQATQLIMDKNFSDLLFLTPVWKRSYPAGADVAHVVGYVAEITKEELERHPEHKGGDLIGKNGIEAWYEQQLQGTAGERVIEVDARGRQLREISYTPSSKGKDIKLTIDLGAQRFASKLLRNFRGAIVALDVTDGSVKCLVSSPSYDPNPLTWGITSDEWAVLLDSKTRPMMNRAISGAYPPASTFKVVTASAGLLNQKIANGTVVNCPGYFELGNRKFRCWNHAGHGNETVVKALRDSCDVFFYQTSWWLGIDKLIDTAAKFGVGSKTGIDLTSEASGTLAGPKWKKKRIKENWYGGDTVNYSIGQGYLLMTPLQVARVYAAIASNGKLFRPKINSALETEFEKISLSDELFKTLQKGLMEVGSIGTGRAASAYGVKVAGKTGTAQNSQGADHAWFAGYAPVDNPKYAVVAIAEAGKGGGKVTGPMVGKMLNYLINHKEDFMFDDLDFAEPESQTDAKKQSEQTENQPANTDNTDNSEAPQNNLENASPAEEISETDGE